MSRVSAGSIIHRLGDKNRLLSLAAGLTARGLQHQIEYRRWTEGALAFLPGADDGVRTCRAWLAWVELARSDEAVEPPVTRAREAERGLLAASVDHWLARNDLDLTRAVIEGLCTAIWEPTRPMPPARARELLTRHLRRLGVPVTPDEAAP